MDGLKPSQRKILYSAFKKNLTQNIKVSQFAAYVSENTEYKHGEESLNQAIMGMCQIFPGSNNICLLYPGGNHGHRIAGGDDRASPRYTYTKLFPLTHKIFRKEDNVILKHIIILMMI
jgi:DNA topoisomerase-2